MPRRVHDKVDVWDEGGWWEGTVTHVTKLRLKVQPIISQTIISARLQDARACLLWADNDWRKQRPGTAVLFSLQRDWYTYNVVRWGHNS